MMDPNAHFMMKQFRAVRNSAGNLYISELVMTHWGFAWRGVALYQINHWGHK